MAVMIGYLYGAGQVVAATSGISGGRGVNFNGKQLGALQAITAGLFNAGRLGGFHNASSTVGSLQPNTHAEMKILNYINRNGITPVVMGVSRAICTGAASCSANLARSGATLYGN